MPIEYNYGLRIQMLQHQLRVAAEAAAELENLDRAKKEARLKIAVIAECMERVNQHSEQLLAFLNGEHP
jgi:hypothetical protein